MVGVGIIGYGKMGMIRADVIRSMDDSHIVGVFEPSCENCDFFMYESVDQMLEDDKVDAVFICTPNKFNEEYSIRALNHGKHVFCEKPPAFNAEGVKRVMDAERNSGKRLMYGFNHRHHGSVIRAKEIIDSGQFGKILWMRGRYGKRITEDQADGWRMKKSESGGGILLDQGIHMLDLLMHFGGEFDVVQAIVSNLYWNMEIEDNAFVNLLNTQNGIAASLHSTMTEWRFLFALEIFLERGYIVINGLKTPSGSYGEEKLTIGRNIAEPPSVEFDLDFQIYDTDHSWDVEGAHFINAINNGTPIKTGTSVDAYRVMKIIDEVYENGIRQRVLD